MKFRNLTFVDLLKEYEDETLSVISNLQKVINIINHVEYSIMEDRVLIRVRENNIRQEIGNEENEDFVNKMVALIREHTIVPLLMVNMGYINRDKLRSSACASALMTSIMCLTPFNLAAHYSDNISFIRAIDSNGVASIASKYVLFAPTVMIKLDSDSILHQFVYDNYNVYMI